jgi:hypothetical protein
MPLALDSQVRTAEERAALKAVLLDMLDDGLMVYDHFGSHFGCNGRPLLDKNYACPFPLPEQKEYRPGFRLHRTADGRIHFADFVTGLQGNCFEFIMRLLGCDYSPLANTNIVQPKPRLISTKPVLIEPWQREWDTAADSLDYVRYDVPGISLGKREQYHCYALGGARITRDSESYIIRHCAQNPVYGYWYKHTNHWKISRPVNPNKKARWSSNTRGEDDIFGQHLLPPADRPAELGLIGAGQRDTMLLSTLMDEIGHPEVWVGCLNSESAHLSPDQYALLKTRLRRMASLTDPDAAGAKAAANLEQWAIPTLNRLWEDLQVEPEMDLCAVLSLPIMQSAERRQEVGEFLYQLALYLTQPQQL